MPPDLALTPGREIHHPRFGPGVIISNEDGYVRAFFREGVQVVAAASLRPEQSWDQQVVAALRPASATSLRRLRLALEAHDLPLQGAAAALTAAKVDLLPHQLVLTHHVTAATPRRFLIADDVGLGKTVEVALVLRELASRGELTRALMVVPAGLVENWRRELNEVFHLDFEVFGSSGDVSDRQTNAFARHHRLIASIDTLKRAERMKRLAEAPPWDLVVFDEAHHLTATRLGNRTTRTQNYRLGELLRDHTRDLLLLSATPHQGDHFRFLSLLRLLHPTLFADVPDMLENRHRLGSIVIRRTKADVSRDDGSPLFARRQVHTQLFTLQQQEQQFYQSLTTYIRDGYNLAAAQGGQGRAIGFVMTVFQKIAASSFAAVRRTLQRRLFTLTLHEALGRERAMEVRERDALLAEARQMLTSMHSLADTPLGRAKADGLLAEARLQLMRHTREDVADQPESREAAADAEAEAAALLVEHALPQERRRIRELLAAFPSLVEAKTVQLLSALEQIWGENPAEKIIIFTTYLGSVDTLKAAIEARFAGVGVEVLKGGDQGAKTAAERRFRRPDGPRVLISTAAGREGINLQFARILFNHDLPWNPMDLEQRIGRIHRYGQHDTVQVYNLVAADTIEGKVFLLLQEKIKAVALALGKVDQRGEVTEDLHTHILGQLGERLSFNRLYQQALADPTLRRTEQELAVALDNANRAREVVGQLFQNLADFVPDGYPQLDTTAVMQRLRAFTVDAVDARDGEVIPLSATRFRLQLPNQPAAVFTTDREEAMADEQLQLLGLEHPLIARLLREAAELPAAGRALLLRGAEGGVQALWETHMQDAGGRPGSQLLRLSADDRGALAVAPYHPADLEAFTPPGATLQPPPRDRETLALQAMPSALRGHLTQSGRLPAGASYQARLVAWLEVVPRGSPAR